VKLAQAPWHVISRQPREIALAEVKRLHHLLWWIGFGMILLAVNVGGRFVNSFVGSIRQLTADAKRMASGDLSQPVMIEDRQDELTTLADAFERMRIELGRSRAILEQRLKEREEFIRIKEEFLANVSHELRTPLHVIMGYTDILTEQEDDELKLGMLAHIRTKSDQLFRLLSDLMMVSGINAGKTSLKIGFVRVKDLLEIVTSLVERLRQEKDITVVYDVPASLPTMETDGLRLEQILSNLVTNAVKFTEHGQITISVRYASPQDTMIFAVSDTGIGIPSNELPFIFDEFHQVDGSVSRTYGGMGLGLAVVKKLVELLQGEITVASQPGKGSTFTVTLPLRLQVDTLQPQECPPLMWAVG
jgi:signal transduction histidine kinase